MCQLHQKEAASHISQEVFHLDKSENQDLLYEINRSGSLPALLLMLSLLFLNIHCMLG